MCERIFSPECFAFHHNEPEHKDFTIAECKGHSISKLLKEVEKCSLVCHNCHAEIHNEMKQRDGYENKIKGNTELWQKNKLRKLNHISQCSCSKCGYNEYVGALAIIFPDELKHYRKYNKTYWDQDFINALDQATVLCQNCIREKATA